MLAVEFVYTRALIAVASVIVILPSLLTSSVGAVPCTPP